MYLHVSLDYIYTKARWVQLPFLELNGLYPIAIFLSFCIHWMWLQNDSRQKEKTWLLKFSDLLLIKNEFIKIFVAYTSTIVRRRRVIEIQLYYGIKNSYTVTKRGHVAMYHVMFVLNLIFVFSTRKNVFSQTVLYSERNVCSRKQQPNAAPNSD